MNTLCTCPGRNIYSIDCKVHGISGSKIPVRFIVRESYGYGHRGGIRIIKTTAPRELAYSTVTGYIRDLKKWAGGYADHITDVNSAGWRLITAHHWINGFENIRVLQVQKSTVYNRIQLGME